MTCMTGKKMISLTLSNEMMDQIYDLRATGEYKRSSIAEVVRQLIEAGLEAFEREQMGEQEN